LPVKFGYCGGIRRLGRPYEERSVGRFELPRQSLSFGHLAIGAHDFLNDPLFVEMLNRTTPAGFTHTVHHLGIIAETTDRLR
jgi:hypothetical protein